MSQTTVVANGRYFWELVFSIDNSDNTGEIVRSTKIRRTKKISSRELLANKFNIRSAFTFNNKSSVSLKFDGVGDGSNTTDQTLHLEVANELQRTAETGVEINEETEFQESFTIGAGGKLDIFRLCYTTDGAITKSDIIATSPRDDVIVNLQFTANKRILGLEAILDRFRNIFPGSSNIKEWERIRNGIVAISDKTDEVAFRRFVEILGGIEPGRENTLEWANIRQTCSEILSDFDNTEKQNLFKKLLTRFETIRPGSSNKAEWAAIRELSDSILNSISQIF